MLTCYMCGETKSEAEFAFAVMAKGTRQRHCRKCQAAYRRAHYLANRDEYIRREVARINGYRVENRALMIAYLLAHPCVDCGCANPVMLDFDHRAPSEKKGNVSELAMRQPWRLVLVEIAKCDVRCANCHLRRTALQFNWKKARNEPIIPGPWLARQLTTSGTTVRLSTQHTGATKVCTGCAVSKPVEQFRLKNKAKGTRGTRCRDCRSAYSKRHYARNRDQYLKRAKTRRTSGGRMAYWSWLMTYLQSHPCVDCGETDPLVLQFDHREGTKKVETIGTMVNRANWNTLLTEVAKCDVRCANCHRLQTARRFSWSKWIRESA